MFRKIFALMSVAASLAAAPLAAQRPVEVGETVTGTLEEGDPQTEDGAYYELYVIRGRRGQTVVIRMSSGDFDTYLDWGNGTDPYWHSIARNDDWGDGTDSRLVVRLGDEGEYELRAAGFDKDETGAYELRVDEMAPPSVAGTIRPGETVEGELAETDYAGIGGYQDQYVIRGRDGETITISLQSEEFDPFVVFGLWRNGEVDLKFEDDDSGPGTGAELVTEFYNGSEHRIVVRSYSGGATGRYTLRVASGAHPEGEDDEEEGVEAGVDMDTTVVDFAEDAGEDEARADSSGIVGFVLGQPIEGWIGEDGLRDEEARGYQEYIFRARPGTRLRFLVVTSDIDPLLQVGTGMNERFQALAWDEDLEAADGRSELTWTVESPRAHTLRVTDIRPAQSGSYVLTVQSPR